MLSKEWQPALGLLWDRQSQASGAACHPVQGAQISQKTEASLHSWFHSHCHWSNGGGHLPAWIQTTQAQLLVYLPPISAMQWSCSMSLRLCFLHYKKMCNDPNTYQPEKLRKIINTKQLVQSWNITNFECMI